ncbi:MAG: hypothetical protein IMZ64_14795 [Bacteroidetes bacterium]|nr:hypothetical protein [Bacteroidota bacterium]
MFVIIIGRKNMILMTQVENAICRKNLNRREGDNMSKYIYIRASQVRKLIKESGKRCGVDFLSALDKDVAEKVKRCCGLFNGNHKTLDGVMVNLTK